MSTRREQALNISQLVRSLGESAESGTLSSEVFEESMSLMDVMLAEESWVEEAFHEAASDRQLAWLGIYWKFVEDARLAVAWVWAHDRPEFLLERPSEEEVLRESKNLARAANFLQFIAQLDPGEKSKKRKPGRPEREFPKGVGRAFAESGYPRRQAKFREALVANGIDLTPAEVLAAHKSLKRKVDLNRAHEIEE